VVFAVGAGYACIGGPGLHRYAAFQIAVAAHGDSVLAGGAGTRHGASVLLVPAGAGPSNATSVSPMPVSQRTAPAPGHHQDRRIRVDTDDVDRRLHPDQRRS
jgi:hypothetical protein